ncbi:OmpA family protein [Vibrio tritonius]|uniref:OmpA family protein n=1 Tax=Vibrio tritonius TaxID=1435069 RepID=UPI000837CF16|nr:OmpA family protein [Vibrio tritonius]
MKKISCLLAVVLVLTGCEATQRQNATTGEQETNSATKGAMIGAVAGVLTGLATGKSAKDRRKRALIGVTGGAAIGAGVGYYFDRQEAALRKELVDSGVQVKRIGDGQLVLVMQNGIGFQSNSYNLDASIYKSLNGVARILVEYPKTQLLITGHTDSSGSASYNQQLSEQRASSVRTYLIGQKVASNRIQVQGAGESQPICSNNTQSGRKCNRRVEISILPLE